MIATIFVGNGTQFLNTPGDSRNPDKYMDFSQLELYFKQKQSLYTNNSLTRFIKIKV